MKRAPLAKKSPRKKRGPAVTCERQRCSHRVRDLGLCASHLEAEADRLFSLKIRAGGQCLASDGSSFWRGSYFPCSGSLQCAHLISRRYHATRWIAANAVPLCAAHHRWLDTHPLEKDDMAANWFGFSEGGWDNLRLMARTADPMNPADVVTWYRLEDA